MNEEKEFKYLNEERYESVKGKIKKASIIVLIVGILLGCILIAVGVYKQKLGSNSPSAVGNLQKDLDTEKAALEQTKTELETKISEALATAKQALEVKKSELTAKGIKYDSSAKYDDGETYDLKIVTNALDPSFDNCAFDEYKNNELTKEYCALSNKTDEDSKGLKAIKSVLDSNFSECSFSTVKNNSYTTKACSIHEQIKNKTTFGTNHSEIAFYILGAFIIIASCMIAGTLYLNTKSREIMAYQAQQVMPVAQEGIEKMAPTIGKAGATAMKEMAPAVGEVAKEMAPAAGEIAKEIAKGVKSGLKDEK